MHTHSTAEKPSCQGVDIGAYKRAKWSRLKGLSLQIADLYDRSEAYGIYGGKIRACSEHMVVREYEDTQTEIAYSMFCGCRFCPVCQSRRSLKAFNQLSRCMDYMDEERRRAGKTPYVYLHVSLTIANVSGPALPEAVDRLYASYVRLDHNLAWKHAIRGVWRTLEVTYNPDRDDYHPHLHCFCAVLPSYFSGANYISKDKLIGLWQECARLPYRPSVDIHRLTDSPERGGLREVTKYITKSKDILKAKRDSVEVLEYMHAALHGRKLFTSYGVIRKTMRILHMSDEDGSLLDITDSDDALAAGIRAELQYAIRVLLWTDDRGYLPVSDWGMVVNEGTWPRDLELHLWMARLQQGREQLQRERPELFEYLGEEEPQLDVKPEPRSVSPDPVYDLVSLSLDGGAL